MIAEEKLKEICDNYGIDYKKIINNNNILIYGDITKIKAILDFLKDELNINSKNIEKCPSILYGEIDKIKENWAFLNKSDIKKFNVETCLHILATEPKELIKTYNYIRDNFGMKYINKNTSILSVSMYRIQNIEKAFSDFSKLQIIQAAYSRFNIEEIKDIVEVCKENKIEITGNVFLKSAEEIKDIVKVCKENGIEITGSVFRRTAEEIKDIAEVCKENGIKITGGVFLRTAEEIKDIVEVCKENGIEITGSMFLKSAEEIKDIVEVCKGNGIEITRSMFLKSAGEIKDIVEICKENGIEITGSMFLKSAEEIKDIVEVCKENGIEITGSVFYKSAETLKNNVIYIKENYGSKYITNLTVSKNYNNLIETLPYLKENGWLDVIINSASILSLTLDEIKQRKSFIESIGEEVVVENKKRGKKVQSYIWISKKQI